MDKILKLPTAFDENEWFILATMLLLFVCFLAVPKIMPRGMTIAALLFFGVLGLTADVLIGVDYPIDFYTITDSPQLELFDVFVYIVNYPLYGYFFAYAIYRFKLDWKRLTWFIPLWSAVTALCEIAAVRFRVFTYLHGWNTGWSALTYLLAFAFAAAAVRFFIRVWR